MTLEEIVEQAEISNQKINNMISETKRESDRVDRNVKIGIAAFVAYIGFVIVVRSTTK